MDCNRTAYSDVTQCKISFPWRKTLPLNWLFQRRLSSSITLAHFKGQPVKNWDALRYVCAPRGGDYLLMVLSYFSTIMDKHLYLVLKAPDSNSSSQVAGGKKILRIWGNIHSYFQWTKYVWEELIIMEGLCNRVTWGSPLTSITLDLLMAKKSISLHQ